MTDALRFVVCPSYHGATALAFLLNSHSQLSSLGDTLPWQDRNQSCSCGSRVDDCAFWQEVRRRVRAGSRADDVKMLPLLPRLVAAPGVNRPLARALVAASLAFGPGAGRLAPRASAEFTDAYRVFYDAVRELHGTRHVVDGSKSIGKVLALIGLGAPGRRARVLHLVRDPRGYAYSLQRRRSQPVELAATGRQWQRMHRAIAVVFGRLGRIDCLRIRYEDLCRDTPGTMDRVFEFFGVEPIGLTGAVRDPRKDHIIGNQMLRDFDGRLRLDERWRQALGAEEQARVLRGTGGLAQAWGYR